VLFPLIALLSLFLFIPFAKMIELSFRTFEVGGVGPPTIDNYVYILFNSYIHKLVFNSLVYAVSVTISCFLIAYPIAFYMARTKFRYREFLLFLLIVPHFLVGLLRVFAWINILAEKGIISFILGKEAVKGVLFSPISVSIGFIYVFLPFMIFPIYSSIKGIDVELEQAAYSIGADKFKTFVHITFPLSKSGVIAGSLIVFVLTYGSFVIPSILGGSGSWQLGNYVVLQFLSTFDYPAGAAAAVLMLVTVLIFVLIFTRFVRLEEVWRH
jgi:spermidine/putrescine transport system permease protein